MRIISVLLLALTCGACADEQPSTVSTDGGKTWHAPNLAERLPDAQPHYFTYWYDDRTNICLIQTINATLVVPCSDAITDIAKKAH